MGVPRPPLAAIFRTAPIPAEWWPIIAPVGSPEEAAAYVASIVEAGADAVAFFPSPFEPLEDSELAATQLLALLP